MKNCECCALRTLIWEDIMRGQYQDYEAELGKSSNTETYVALKLAVDKLALGRGAILCTYR